MDIVEDYFLLYHGLRHHQKHCYIDFRLQTKDDFLEIAAIFLSVNRKNINDFLSTSTFKELISKYFQNGSVTIDDLYDYQYNILEFLSNQIASSDFEVLQNYFSFLQNNEIVSKEEYNKLTNIFKIIKIKKENKILSKTDENVSKDVDSDYFFTQKNFIEDIINEYEQITDQNLNEIKKTLNSQKFSIGVTGIINSGKSTMLNALLGQELLGTSVVPETANLSVIKYAKNTKAVVKFWSEKEWQNIENEADAIPSIAKFVKETKKIFKDKIKQYIKPENKTLQIAPEELPKFTSANHPSKLCNLVQSIELYSDIDFLQEGIEIVDTPGLDDPVIQREEITKSYLGKCDTLLHLMNVNQAATLSDINFIINTLLYHSISKLIIVLTKADTVTKGELEEVLFYTKNSIKKSLQNINHGDRYNFILQKLEFIPLSAKEALFCKIHPEISKQKGYDLNKTGLLEVEKSLRNLLFGKENEKNKITINSIKIKLKNIIKNKIENIELDLQLLSKTKDEIQVLAKEFENKNKEHRQLLSNIKEELKLELFYIKEQSFAYKKIVFDKIDSLSKTLTQRVVDDIRYELQKNGSLPKNERVEYIFENGKKDGLLDILRDYHYALYKLIVSSKEKISNKFPSLQIKPDENEYNQKLSNEIIDKVVLSNNSIVKQLISKSYKSTRLKHINTLQNTILTIINEHFEALKAPVEEAIETLSKQKLKEYKDELQIPLNELQNKLNEQEEILSLKIKESSLSEHEKDKKRELLYEKLTRLRNLENKADRINS